MADDLLTGGGEAPLQPGTPRPANTITDERLMEIVNAVYTPTVWSDTLVQGTPDIPGKMNALEQYIATLTEVNRDMALAVIALRDSVSRIPPISVSCSEFTRMSLNGSMGQVNFTKNGITLNWMDESGNKQQKALFWPQ